MDMYEILGNDTGIALRQYRDRVVQSQRALDQYSKLFESNLKDERDDAINSQCNAAKQSLCKELDDPLDLLKKLSVPEAAAATTSLLEAFPATAGFRESQLAAYIHSTALDLCNKNLVVLAAAYLYVATRRASLLHSEWSDMDFILQADSRQRLVALGNEQDAAMIAKSFAIALGVPLASFQKGRRPPLPQKITNRNARVLFNNNDPLMNAMKEGLMGTTSSITAIDHAVMKSAFAALKILGTRDVKDTNLVNVREDWKTHGKTTPVGLLQAFTKVFLSNELNVNFDYTSFYLTCLQMLHRVRIDCKSLLESTHPNSKLRQNDAELVYAVLWDAADRSVMNKTSLLRPASNSINEIISTNGSTYLNKAKAHSSGHMPRDIAPVHRADDTYCFTQRP